jgi:hypothetical protein
MAAPTTNYMMSFRCRHGTSGRRADVGVMPLEDLSGSPTMEGPGSAGVGDELCEVVHLDR